MQHSAWSTCAQMQRASGQHQHETLSSCAQDLEEKCAKDFWTTTAIEMAVWPPYQVICVQTISLMAGRPYLVFHGASFCAYL